MTNEAADPRPRGKKPMTSAEKTAHYMEMAMKRMSAANRSFAAEFTRHRLNEGLAFKSVYKYVNAMGHLDRHLDGRLFALATPDELACLVEHLRTDMKPTSTHAMVVCLRKVLKAVLDVDELPRHLNRALYMREPRAQAMGRLVSAEDFQALLSAARIGEQGGYSTMPRTERSQAILWTLWESGFRASELLSLNVGDVVFDGHRGAQLRLRPEAPDLKTGARTIYVVECVGPIRAWLELHPRGMDAKAPLFTSLFDRTGLRRLNYQQLHAHVKSLGERSGVNKSSSREKPLSPHDFRHSAATRDAKKGWMEAELRAKYGWAAGSHMPSLYVHLALGDMRARVRRDAGIDNDGYAQAVAAQDETAILKAALRSLLRDEPPGPTQKPVAHR
jgi:integrase